MHLSKIKQALLSDKFTREELADMVLHNYGLLTFVLTRLAPPGDSAGALLIMPPNHPLVPYCNPGQPLMDRLNVVTDELVAAEKPTNQPPFSQN